jgi:hypothetical protein
VVSAATEERKPDWDVSTLTIEELEAYRRILILMRAGNHANVEQSIDALSAADRALLDDLRGKVASATERRQEMEAEILEAIGGSIKSRYLKHHEMQRLVDLIRLGSARRKGAVAGRFSSNNLPKVEKHEFAKLVWRLRYRAASL